MTSIKMIEVVKLALKKGLKWTLGIVGNNKSMSISSLKFEPIELISGLNASAFLDCYRVIGGNIRGCANIPKYKKSLVFDGVAVNGTTLSRASEIAARLIDKLGGKAALKLRKVLEDKALENAVNTVDAISDELCELQAKARIAHKATERAILKGVITEDKDIGANELIAERKIQSEINEVKNRLAKAKADEKTENERLISEIWGDDIISLDEGEPDKDNKDNKDNK